jgi:mannose-6-phosphate isomerase
VTLPRLLPSTPHEKVWGSDLTQPWFANPGRQKIGEIWFQASDQAPLLVKLLFTSDKLSVQVHPKDDYAREHENSPGKTEMWHILRADPGAQVALGLTQEISKERLREVSLSGEIEQLLRWYPAAQGDTFYVPAGTIHAIGGGLVLCEIQQISDVTYRLYDYGRPRELHLDRGIEVSNLGPYRENQAPVAIGSGHQLLAEGPYFRTERLDVKGAITIDPPQVNTILVMVHSAGLIAGQPFTVGQAWEVQAGKPCEISSVDAVIVATSAK